MRGAIRCSASSCGLRRRTRRVSSPGSTSTTPWPRPRCRFGWRHSPRPATRWRRDSSSALDHAEEERGTSRPEEVQIGLALFVTHNHDGRRLAKPRTVAAAPGLFNPPRAGVAAPRISIGGPSPGLDYWREDVLANEHHQHWHEVYPFPGLPPRSFPDWLADHTTDELVEILEALAPDRDWAAIVPTLTQAQLAGLFGRRPGRRCDGLSFHASCTRSSVQPERPSGRAVLLHARADARALRRRAPVARPRPRRALRPGRLGRPDRRGPRPDRASTASAGASKTRHSLPRRAPCCSPCGHEVDDALAAKSLRGLGGGTVPIDRTNLGEAVESTAPQLQGARRGCLPWASRSRARVHRAARDPRRRSHAVARHRHPRSQSSGSGTRPSTSSTRAGRTGSIPYRLRRRAAGPRAQRAGRERRHALAEPGHHPVPNLGPARGDRPGRARHAAVRRRERGTRASHPPGPPRTGPRCRRSTS